MKSTAKDLLRRLGVTRARAGSIRVLADRAMLATVRGKPRRSRGRVLCYHSIGTPEWGVNDVTPARFRQQIETALRAGYKFVTASTIACGGGTQKELAVSFDDGLKSVATQAAPILREFGIPWTLFIVPGWIDGNGPRPDLLLSWRDVERAMASGADVGSHSATHRDFSRLGASELEYELICSGDTIRARLGVSPRLFAIPNGRRRDWSGEATGIASRAGYEHVFAACEDRRAAGTVGRSMVTSWDGQWLFRRMLEGAFDGWEEWIP